MLILYDLRDLPGSVVNNLTSLRVSILNGQILYLLGVCRCQDFFQLGNKWRQLLFDGLPHDV